MHNTVLLRLAYLGKRLPFVALLNVQHQMNFRVCSSTIAITNSGESAFNPTFTYY